MEIVSRCPLRVGSVLWQRGPGDWVLTVACKATFQLAPGESPLAAEQERIYEADAYRDSDERRSLKVAGDLVPFKGGPEVLLVGHAHAPEGRPATSLVAVLAVGRMEKAIEVFGNRNISPDGAVSEPARFVRMPLLWELASGGHGMSNPVGVPTGGHAHPDRWGQVHVPNLQPAGMPPLGARDVVPPACFAPVAPSWPTRAAALSRIAAAGALRRWNERPLPQDLDPACFNAAPSDQRLGDLTGEETLHVEHLHAHHARLTTRLAPARPRVTVRWDAGRPSEIGLACDTLWIDADRGIATLVFRGHVPLDHPQRAGWIEVHLDEAPARAQVPASLSRASEDPEESGAASLVLPPPRQQMGARAQPFRPTPPPRQPVDARALPFRPAASAPARPTRPPEEAAALPFRPAEGAPASSPRPPELEASALPFRPAEGAPASSSRPLEPDTSALPFRPPEGALVGASALGRSMRLKSPGTIPPPQALRPGAPDRDAAPGADPPPEAPPYVALAPAPYVAPAPAPYVAPAPAPPEAPPYVAPAPAYVVLAPRAEPALAPLPMASDPPAPPPLLGSPSRAEAAPDDLHPPPAGEAARPIAAPEPREPPGDAPLPLDAYPMERCARIDASIGRREGEAREILEAQALTEALWTRLDGHWKEAVAGETARGKSRLQKAYDAAYVAQLEEERGPITVEEHARIVVAAERGEAASALPALGLPSGALMRIRRVWMARTAADPALGVRARRAIEADRDR